MELEDLDKIVLGKTKIRECNWVRGEYLLVEWFRTFRSLLIVAGVYVNGNAGTVSAGISRWEFYKEPEELLEEWEYIRKYDAKKTQYAKHTILREPFFIDLVYKAKTGRKFRVLADGMLELVE